MPRGQRNTNTAPSLDATTRAIVRSEIARFMAPFVAAFSGSGPTVTRRRGPNKRKARATSKKSTS